MHDIDMMLKLQLDGHHVEARAISDKLEALGKGKVLDTKGQATDDIWMRHCFNRGWFKIQEGDYQEGCKLLENGRFLNVYGSPPLKTNAPIFNPDTMSIKDKSIIVSLEGGYGDEIIHARFATSYKKLGAKAVYIAAAPELVSVFERIEGVDGVILRDAAHTVEHDYWVPGFSAGWVAGHTFDDFPSDPYLTTNAASANIWKSIITSDKIKVGIRWAGNPKFEHQQFRRFPEEFITNLAKYDELDIYSLQRDHNTLILPDNITDLQHFLLSWEDTIAAIANLDIVISSCTSVAHLAAAMGKETWVIVPILPYHTWTYKSSELNTSPYYNCVRLFRQQESKKWNGTFQDLYTALEERFNLKHIDLPDCDKELKKINLGCGLKKIEGFHNVDISESTQPDEVVDLNQTPWPWEDNSFDHIVAKDILEHLGRSPENFIDIIKEMYRISRNGAIWEVQSPHWRSDHALDDPTHVRAITPGTFHLFNMDRIYNGVNAGRSDTPLAFDHNIDLELCDMQFEYNAYWLEQLARKEITPEQLQFILNYNNNVASSVQYLIQVHKPGRFTVQEYHDLIKNVKHEVLIPNQ